MLIGTFVSPKLFYIKNYISVWVLQICQKHFLQRKTFIFGCVCLQILLILKTSGNENVLMNVFNQAFACLWFRWISSSEKCERDWNTTHYMHFYRDQFLEDAGAGSLFTKSKWEHLFVLFAILILDFYKYEAEST